MNRNRWLSQTLVFTGLLAMTCCLALAQDGPRSGTADIPFDFYIAGNKLPAGHYALDVIAPTYVTIRSQDGKVQQDLYFLQSSVPTKNMPTQIVFVARDNKYYFSEVWSWYGKSQLTSFNAKAGEKTRAVPLKAVEKIVAKP
jgi:hypothetical protein